jgi:hypothetical protein
VILRAKIEAARERYLPTARGAPRRVVGHLCRQRWSVRARPRRSVQPLVAHNQFDRAPLTVEMA